MLVNSRNLHATNNDSIDRTFSTCSPVRWAGAALFPVFQSAHVCSQIDCEKCARKSQVLSHPGHFSRCDARRSLEFQRVSSERSLAVSHVSESIRSFAYFRKQITLGATLSCGFN